MKNDEKSHAHILGWGVDSDPENEPTYPIKSYTGDDHLRSNWVRPARQPVDMEILHSIERPGVSAVFGTSVPLSGLSGSIRRYAFRFSESDYRHWLPLLLADRVNVVEGIIDDLRNGYIPNLLAERGLKGEWKVAPVRLAAKVAVTALATAAVVALLRARARNRRNRKNRLVPAEMFED